MLKQGIYLLILIALLTTVGCTKSTVVEPSGVSVSQRGGDVGDDTGDEGFISDDDDDEGDSERDRTSSN